MESGGESKRTTCSKTISKKKSLNPRETLLAAQEIALILKMDQWVCGANQRQNCKKALFASHE